MNLKINVKITSQKIRKCLPKTSIAANLDPKMTPKWSPKSKKNPSTLRSEYLDPSKGG